MRDTLAPSAIEIEAQIARLRAAAMQLKSLPPEALQASLVFASVYAATWLAAMAVAVATLHFNF